MQVRDFVSPVLWLMGMLLAFIGVMTLLVGCSSGLQEKAFVDDRGYYIVNRSLVNDRVTANQPHAQGVFVCQRKISSEQMAVLNRDGEIHSWYVDCARVSEYSMTSDQPIGTLYKGPVEAAILGGAIGAGLALSGDTNVQKQGQGSANLNFNQNSATSKSRGRH